MGLEEYDVAIVGGGASGLAAAIGAARSGSRVLVVERDVACGLPILATGNGRCNLSNVRLDPARYRDPDAARAVMGPAPEAAVGEFFASLGLMTCEVEDRLYPVTRRADSVRDVLLAACAREGVALRCGCELFAAERVDGAWTLALREPARPVRYEGDVRRARKALGAARLVGREVRAAALVLAVGGASERMCRLLGIPHASEIPVLCPLACVPACPAASLFELDGLRAEASLALVRDGRELHRERGEVLFRPYGISGIAAFDLSRRACLGDTVELDLFPQLGTGELIGSLRAREDAVGPFVAEPAWFDGVLARPLAGFVSRLALADGPAPADGLRGDALTSVAKLLKRVPLEVSGLAEERQAQVRRGGVPLVAMDLGTLAVAGRPGLFACGEALDQDADCGGFNLAWAWLSGLTAGASAAREAARAAGEACRL